MTEHLGQADFEDYNGNTLSADRRASIESHLRGCGLCRSELHLVRAIDSALREAPAGAVSANFTGRVMRDLGITESKPLIWSFLSNLAPFVAMAIVSGLIYVALALAGVMKPEAGGTSPVVDYRPLGDAVGKGIGALNDWLLSATSDLGMTTTTAVFLVLLLAVILMADRLLFVPFFRRRGLRV